MALLDLLQATKPPQPRKAGLGTLGDALDPQVTPAQPSAWQRIIAGLSDAGQALQGGQGDAVSTLKAKYQSDADSAVKRVQLTALAKSLHPDDPAAQMAFIADPKSALEAYYKNQEGYTLGEGQQRFVGGNRIAAVGKTGVQDGFGYSVDADGNTTWGAQRPKTYADLTAEATAAEAVRNHDLEHTDRVASNVTTQRGQDLTARASAASTGATIRGQNMTAGTAANSLAFQKQKAVMDAHPDAAIIRNAADYNALPSGAKYIAPGEFNARTKR